MTTSHVFNDISLNSEANSTLASSLAAVGATIIPMKVDIAERLEKVLTNSYATDALLQVLSLLPRP
jgi:hypothetical protein